MMNRYRVPFICILSLAVCLSASAFVKSAIDDFRNSAPTKGQRVAWVPADSGGPNSGGPEGGTIGSRLTPKSPASVATIVEESGTVDESRDVDVGEVNQGENFQHTFALRNSTDRPISITGLRKSCACQSLDLVEGTIVPAGKIVTFTYGAPASLAGRQSAKLVLKTDSTDASLREITFALHAEVKGTITATPSLVKFGRIPRGQTSQQEIVLTCADSTLLARYRGASSTRSLVRVSSVKQTPDELHLRIEVPSATAPGHINDVVILRFSGHDEQTLNVFVPVQGIMADDDRT